MPHGRGGIAERVLDDKLLLRLAENEADAWLIARMFEEIVHRCKVEVHLAGVLRLERSALQVFCGARRYVALAVRRLARRPAVREQRHITACARKVGLSVHFQ